MARKPITIQVNRPDPRNLPDTIPVTGRRIHYSRVKLFYAEYDITRITWRIVVPSKGNFQPLPDSFTDKAIGCLNSFSSEHTCRDAIGRLIERIEAKIRTNPLILVGVKSITLSELFSDNNESEKE